MWFFTFQPLCLVKWENNVVIAWLYGVTGVVHICVYKNLQKRASPLFIWNSKKMLLFLLFASALGLLSLTPGGIDLQTDKRTKSDLIKSLIFDNINATITLDSSALKQLIDLSSGKYQRSNFIWKLFKCLPNVISYNMFGLI